MWEMSTGHPLTEYRHQYHYFCVPIWRKACYTERWALGEWGRVSSVLCVLKWAFKAPAPPLGSRILTWEIEGFGYSNIHMTSEIGAN